LIGVGVQLPDDELELVELVPLEDVLELLLDDELDELPVQLPKFVYQPHAVQ
jgi:hypothetical protein